MSSAAAILLDISAPVHQPPDDQLHAHYNSHPLTIDRYAVADPPLTYDAFFHKYMLPNRPVLIAGIAQQWDCYRHWSTPGGRLNSDYLRERLRRLPATVPVADCCQLDCNAHRKLEMPFDEYLAYWEQIEAGKDGRLLYLKDWHLRHQMPAYEFYRTPAYFAADWLNEALVTGGKDDYRFVYIGPEGTWTPFHADVFGSFSWSTNVAGVKHWLFLPPGEQHKLADRFGQPPFSVDEDSLAAQGVRHISLEQRPGETVFVPSGWYHQVRNETATISVNHNWFNGCNVWYIWQTMLAELGRVRAEIADCRSMADWHGQCQLVLRASHGMDVRGLMEILVCVARRRLEALRCDAVAPEAAPEFDGYRFGREHCVFDLRAIERVVADVAAELGDTHPALRTECEDLLREIAEALKT